MAGEPSSPLSSGMAMFNSALGTRDHPSLRIAMDRVEVYQVSTRAVLRGDFIADDGIDLEIDVLRKKNTMLRIRSRLTRIWTISKMSSSESYQWGMTGDNEEGRLLSAEELVVVFRVVSSNTYGWIHVHQGL